MRLKGVIKSWNDERGFGFIQPAQGGEDIFFHISAFSRGEDRPQVNQRVSFDVIPGRQGKQRARNVELIRFAPYKAKPAFRKPRPRSGAATLYAIPAFVVVYVAVSLLWKTPIWFALVYLLASAITYVAYANDKSSAQRGAQRTQETTLHILSIIGGWPGALLAQQLLRHKSVKAEFRSFFWGTVAFNIGAFLILCSPLSPLYWASQVTP